jgi:hypothetical protein
MPKPLGMEGSKFRNYMGLKDCLIGVMTWAFGSRKALPCAERTGGR